MDHNAVEAWRLSAGRKLAPGGPLPGEEVARKAAVGLLALLAFAVVLPACASSASNPKPTAAASRSPSPLPNASLSPSASPTATPGPVKLAGQGGTNSDPFRLAAGAYKVAFNFSGKCTYFASLKATAGSYANFNFASGNGPTSGDTTLANVPAGTFYIEMYTGLAADCPWTVTFTTIRSSA